MKTWKTLMTAAAVGAIGLGFAAQTMAQGMGPGAGMGMGNAPTFAELDTDSNGQISIGEARAFSGSRFAAMDANGDGVLDAEEMTAHFTTALQAQIEARVARMIAWQDQNGDGALSADEMPEIRMQGLFMHLDSDGDDQISQEEFAAMGERGGMGRGFGDHHGEGHGGMFGKGRHGGRH